MKKFVAVGVMAMAMLFSMTLAAKAEQKPMAIGGEVSIGYMPMKADLSSVYTSGGVVSADSGDVTQNFLPALSAVITIAKPWSATLAYAASGSKTEDTSKIKSTQYMLGARYDFQNGPYATISYGEYKFAVTDVIPADSLTIKYNGFRIGGGYSKEFEGTPFSAGIDVGFGIANQAKLTVAAGSLSPDATRFDFTVKGSYKIGTTGLKADLGYNYISLEHDTITAPNGDTLESSLDVKGPFLGVTYAF
ncbi:MAG: hypothetical protein WCX65_14025 [bacterium]